MDVYVYQAELLCADCAEEIIRYLRASGVRDEGDSDTFPQGPYPDGGGEADTPQHCGYCGTFLENPLTFDGIEYVREALLRPGNPDVLQEWAEFYRQALADEG